VEKDRDVKKLIIALACIITVFLTCLNVYAGDRVINALLLPVVYTFFKDKEHDSTLNGHLVEIDLKNPKIKVGLALPRTSPNKQATVKSMAQSYNAIAAINGSFFHGNAIPAAVGLIMFNDEVITDSRHRRTSLGITNDNEIIIGIPKVTVWADLPEMGENIRVSGVNQMRQYHQTIIYTPYFGKKTQTNIYGREVIIRHNRVIGYTCGDSAIPKDGFVISIHGIGKEVVNRIPLGTTVKMKVDKLNEWSNVKTIITGGPHLVHKGKVYNTYFKEKMNPSLKYPNTRSAVGITHNKKLLLLTVSGGVTYTRLAEILKRLGAVEAMGLDGGGSTGLYLNGNIVNKDSYTSRPVSNALIVTITK